MVIEAHKPQVWSSHGYQHSTHLSSIRQMMGVIKKIMLYLTAAGSHGYIWVVFLIEVMLYVRRLWSSWIWRYSTIIRAWPCPVNRPIQIFIALLYETMTFCCIIERDVLIILRILTEIYNKCLLSAVFKKEMFTLYRVLTTLSLN